MSKEHPGYVVAEPKKGSKIVNIIAPLVLIACFVGGVGYTSVALMGNRNDNYQEKVEQMKKENATNTEVEVVSENLTK